MPNYLLSLILILAPLCSLHAQVRIPGPGGSAPTGGAGTSPTYVTGQVCTASTDGTSVSTLTCNLPNNIAAVNGVLIYLAMTCPSGVCPTTAAADGPGDTFAIPTGCSAAFDTIASPEITTKVYLATNSAGGSKSITINFSGTQATFTAIMGVEIQNVPTSSAVDGSCQTQSQDSGTTIPSVTLTSSVINEYGIAFGIARAVGITFIGSSGYTKRSDLSYSAGTIFFEDQSLPTATTYATTWTDDAGTTRRNVIALVIK